MRPFEETKAVIATVQMLPLVKGGVTHAEVRMFVMNSPAGGSMLLAFGHVPFLGWLMAVNAYYTEEVGADYQPFDLDDDEKIVDSLNRIGYDRVGVDLTGDEESPFDINTRPGGLIPITYWMIKKEARGVDDREAPEDIEDAAEAVAREGAEVN